PLVRPADPHRPPALRRLRLHLDHVPALPRPGRGRHPPVSPEPAHRGRTTMTGPLDPRIAWLRAVQADRELNRAARFVALSVGPKLTYAGEISIGIDELIGLTGYSRAAVRRGLAALRLAGWLQLGQRGRRGRTSVYRADSPGLLHRSEVPVTGAEYGSQVSPTPPEYGSSVSPSAHEYGSRVGPTWAEYGSQVSASGPNRAHQRAGSLTYEELRTYVSPPTPESRPSAAQAPALAVALDPAVSDVIDELPGALRPASSAAHRRLAGLIAQRLQAGWTVEQLIECTASVGQVAVKDAPAFWASLV